MKRPARIEPGPGQESIWDYPRPPRVEAVAEPLRVAFAGETIAATTQGLRVLETAGAPCYYFPKSDVHAKFLHHSPGSTVCEWKGLARYHDVVVDDQVAARAAWSYPDPTKPYREIAGHVSFYPRLVECYLGNERATPQPGGFYGGWVTSRVVGPFKGERGTMGW